MENNQTGMTLIVKTITRLTVGLILIYGIYIVVEGQMGLGGAFAGGVIVALSFVHLMLAFGKSVVLKKINQPKGIIFMSLGAIAFLFLASFSLMGIKNFSGSMEGSATFGLKGVTFYELAIAVTIGAGLFLVFLGLVFLREESKKI